MPGAPSSPAAGVPRSARRGAGDRARRRLLRPSSACLCRAEHEHLRPPKACSPWASHASSTTARGASALSVGFFFAYGMKEKSTRDLEPWRRQLILNTAPRQAGRIAPGEKKTMCFGQKCSSICDFYESLFFHTSLGVDRRVRCEG